MRVVVTGAEGFLGWHLRLRLHATTDHDVVPVGRAEWDGLDHLIAGADAVIHLAGVNRGDETEVEQGNIRLAAAVAAGVRSAGSPRRVVFANSIQAGNGTPYGKGKEQAAELLARAVHDGGGRFVDVLLPNLFGEHGRPGYNSFVATFTHAVLDGSTPAVQDRPVSLLHVQAAAQELIAALEHPGGRAQPAGTPTTVQHVLDTLVSFDELYRTGDIPPLLSPLGVDLFNTLRAAAFPHTSPISLVPRADDRGRLVEIIRSHGGQGQTFVSTTRPGITRGEHYHLRKIERFAVVAGEARISLRKVLTDRVVHFDVSGDVPVAVDMPTGWAHNITNTGTGELTTLFWTHELFDPAAPDTYPEPVVRGADADLGSRSPRPTPTAG